MRRRSPSDLELDSPLYRQNSSIHMNFTDMRTGRIWRKSPPRTTVDSSVRIRGMWNLECAVLPPCRSNAAIPHDATASTILPSERNFVVIAFQRWKGSLSTQGSRKCISY
ncbi:uncharacterized protein [Lolium perenne]|uniref:uncharacterized protein n=1 Tax=Lolium perenne TaxID=4522 RepID=UPI003A99F90C